MTKKNKLSDITTECAVRELARVMTLSEGTPLFPPEPEIPDHYDWVAYSRIQREVKDKASRKDNPEYEECCECGTCFTEDQAKFIYTSLTKQELKERRAYLNKYKEENWKPRIIKWRRVTPLTGLEEKVSED